MQWRSIVIQNKKISQREDSSICAVKDKIYLFGGALDTVCFNQLFSYDLSTQKWKEVQTTGQCPPPRESSIMKYCEQINSIYLYGGQELIDLYVLDLSTNHWTLLTILPLTLSDMYSSNQMHLVYPYLYFPSSSHNFTNGVYQYCISLNQWKFLPFNHTLYLDIQNTVILNGYLYLFGQKSYGDYTHKIWKCNLTTKKQLKLQLLDLGGIKGIEEMNFVNLCAYKDSFYLFSSAKSNQVVVINTKQHMYNMCNVGDHMLRLWGSSTCMLGSCVIALKQAQSAATFQYINLYQEPIISSCTFFPIPIQYYPNIKVTINGVSFMASRERLASNSKLFCLLLSQNPEEVQLRIMDVSRKAIVKLMGHLMQEYTKQKIHQRAFMEKYEYFMELAYLAQYFIVGTLTQEVDLKICGLLHNIDPNRTIEILRLAESLDLMLFAELNASRLIREYISESRIGELLDMPSSKILKQMIAEHKFDIIHRPLIQWSTN